MFRSPIFIYLLFFAFSSCTFFSEKEIVPQIEKANTPNSLQARKFLDLGITHSTSQNLDSAFYFFNRSKIRYELENDSVSIAYALIQMATIQQVFSDYQGSETNLIEALPYIQKNSLYESAAYNLLGISSKELSNYKDAWYYYDKAKSIATDTLAILTIENNKASVSIQKEAFAAAIQLLESIHKSKVLDTIPKTQSAVLDNLGYSYFKMNRNQEGLRLMNQALVIRKKNNDFYGIIGSSMHLAEFFKKNQPEIAKRYALKAYQTAKEIQSVEERLESLSFLMIHTLEKGNTEYTIEYLRVNDSLVNARNSSKNQFAKIKYDTDQNRADNLNLTVQKAKTTLLLERQKNSTLLLYFVVFILIAVTFFIINFLNVKSRREKIKASYTTETRISKQLHDELANDVYYAMTFAETQDLTSEQNKETLLNNLDHIYSRTRNISKENSSIDTGPHFVSHLKGMMANYSNETVNVLINGLEVLQNTTVETNTKIMIYRILQELLVNMKKHSQCNLVVISFRKKNKKIQIEYSDNGVGVPKDKVVLKNGLLNVENRILAINGTLTFDSKNQKGFKLSFEFPA